MQIFLVFFGIILAFIGVALCVGTITLLRAAKRVLGPLEKEASPAPAVEAEVEEEKPEEAPEEKPEDEKAPEEGE